MNIYRVRYQTSEILYVQGKDFADAVSQAMRLRVGDPTLVEFLGVIQGS